VFDYAVTRIDFGRIDWFTENCQRQNWLIFRKLSMTKLI